MNYGGMAPGRRRNGIVDKPQKKRNKGVVQSQQCKTDSDMALGLIPGDAS